MPLNRAYMISTDFELNADMVKQMTAAHRRAAAA